MKVRIDAFNKVSKLYQANNTKKLTSTEKSKFQDKLEISQTGKDYQVAKHFISQVPEVREDKVNDIVERMKSGTYNIGVEEVADKLIGKYFDDMM